MRHFSGFHFTSPYPGSNVSSQYRDRELRIQARFDEEPLSVDSLYTAEHLFARLAVRNLLDKNLKPKSAGPHRRRRAGRALTP